jgi:predicted AlkP superfamily pyrophosphatase or phosphodiesterase
MKDKLLIVDVAGLGYDFLCRKRGDEWEGLKFAPMESVFPAVTCTAQASFRTAAAPAQHGMVANGLWDRRYLKARFWEQSSALVGGERIWQKYRKAGHTVGMLFWQQSMGEDVDVVLTPAPIHKHHGGMIQDCYCQPAGLYADLCRKVGRKFNLMNYWGPLASYKASAWIAEATAALLADSELAPDLCLTYLPVLDYDLQRYGTQHPRSRKALEHLLSQLKMLKTSADKNGYDILIFGDYALGDVTGEPIYPNRELYKQGLLATRVVNGMHYPDFGKSDAFVMVDHEVGHIYVKDSAKIGEVYNVMTALPGVAEVLDAQQQIEYGIEHANSGELVLLADAGLWLAYPWWNSDSEAPDYASHVDIHNKPGYDPAELFFGWPPGSVSRRAERIKGTHGRVGVGRKAAWASTFINGEIDTLVGLADAVRLKLNEM